MSGNSEDQSCFYEPITDRSVNGDRLMDGERKFLEITQELILKGGSIDYDLKDTRRRAAGWPDVSIHFYFFDKSEGIANELKLMHAGRDTYQRFVRRVQYWKSIGFALFYNRLEGQNVPVGLDVASFNQDAHYLGTLAIIRYSIGNPCGKRGFYLDYEPLNSEEIGQAGDALTRSVEIARSQPPDRDDLARSWLRQWRFYQPDIHPTE